MNSDVSEPLEMEHDIEKLRECLREKLVIRNVMRERSRKKNKRNDHMRRRNSEFCYLYFLILYPAMEIVFAVLYRVFRRKADRFTEYRARMVQYGQQAAGRILQVRRHDSRPDDGTNRSAHS